MGKYAGSMRTRALSGAETIHVNGEVLEYLILGNQHGYCAVHTPQCRTHGTMPYAVCRMKYAVREHASSLMSTAALFAMNYKNYNSKNGLLSMKYTDMLHMYCIMNDTCWWNCKKHLPRSCNIHKEKRIIHILWTKVHLGGTAPEAKTERVMCAISKLSTLFWKMIWAT